MIEVFKARRDEPCHEVAESLFLGSLENANNHQLLRELKITAVISLLSRSQAMSLAPFPVEITSFMCHYVDDTESASIRHLFAMTTAFINTTHARGGRVLAHCRAGISRSATIVAAYLMHTIGGTPSFVRRLLRMHRAQVNPNPGFMRQLRWEWQRRTTWLAKKRQRAVRKNTKRWLQ